MSNVEIVEKDLNFKVPFTVIREVKAHPKPEVHSLEIAIVYGWEVIVGKNTNHVGGEKVFYIPPNSLLPQWLENYLFPPDSKIKLDKHRIKAIKIQGFVSQGMIITPADVKAAVTLAKFVNEANFGTVDAAAKGVFDNDTSWILNGTLEEDYADKLGITKYIPPSLMKSQKAGVPGAPGIKKKGSNPNFKKYGGLNNIKWFPDLFVEGELVSVTEKVHGTNFRAGWVPFKPEGFWAKIKNRFLGLFGKHTTYEFVFGSNNVQLQDKGKNPNGYYSENYYLEAVNRYDLKNKLLPGEVIYGEIYGADIQKGYDYALKVERKCVFFDLRYEGKDTSHWSTRIFEVCNREDLPIVPVLYEGPYDKDLIAGMISGPSVLCPQQKVREGIVIKNILNYDTNRKALKCINPAYTIKEAQGETSDFQ